MPTPELIIILRLTKSEADLLEDILDDESERLQKKHKKAGPGKVEKLFNELSEEVHLGIGHAIKIKR